MNTVNINNVSVDEARNRILIKTSGAMYPHQVADLAKLITSPHRGQYRVAVLCGGGNIMRGGRDDAARMQRNIADRIGMLGTVINALHLQDALDRTNIRSKTYSSIHIQGIEDYNPLQTPKEFEQHEAILLAGGIAQGYFSTDTAAILRARELNCILWVKFTKYDAVYDSDPATNTDATRIRSPTYSALINAKSCRSVIDTTAAVLGAHSGPPMLLADHKNLDAKHFWHRVYHLEREQHSYVRAL